MKKIVLHIGTEKTATKSLQQFFCLNRHRLQESGMWYPASDRLDYCQGNAHFPLPASLLPHCPEFISETKHRDPDALYSLLVKDFMGRNEKTAILSAEHFSSRCSKIEQIQTIARHMAGMDVAVVVYLRPQQDLLASAYSTYLMTGGKKSMARVVKEKCLVPGIRYFNYHSMLAPWVKVFGEKSVTVRIFQKGRLKNGDIFDDMLSVLGLSPTAAFNRPEKRNQSMSREAAEFIWRANQHFPEFDEGPRSLWEQGQAFRTEVLPKLPKQYPIQQLLSLNMQKAVKRFYEEANRKLARQLRNDLKGILFLNEEDGTQAQEHPSENCFTPEFVKWIVDQWKASHPAD